MNKGRFTIAKAATDRELAPIPGGIGLRLLFSSARHAAAVPVRLPKLLHNVLIVWRSRSSAIIPSPGFRENDYNGGIRDGVARVADVVEKQQVLTADQRAALTAGSAADALSGHEAPWWLIPFWFKWGGCG